MENGNTDTVGHPIQDPIATLRDGDTPLLLVLPDGVVLVNNEVERWTRFVHTIAHSMKVANTFGMLVNEFLPQPAKANP